MAVKQLYLKKTKTAHYSLEKGRKSKAIAENKSQTVKTGVDSVVIKMALKSTWRVSSFTHNSWSACSGAVKVN